LDSPINSELHLIVLWNKGLSIKNRVLNHIRGCENLETLEEINIRWSKGKTKSNFSRFYGIKLRDVRWKIKECGKGDFLMITIIDNSPMYEERETSRGKESVNSNIFDLKQLFREWSGGGHKVHTTNNIVETEHDIALLLGKSSKDYLAELRGGGEHRVRDFNEDIVGANGWESLSQFFYILNSTINYVVVRNYEYLPCDYTSEEHGDIDIICSDYEEMKLITNAKKVFRGRNRVHCSVNIAGKGVLFDFRFVGDDYYCIEWQQKILRERILENGIFVPSEEDYFHSLVMHAILHKNKIANDYYEISEKLHRRVFPGEEIQDRPFDGYAMKLFEFLDRNGYGITRPIDRSVVFREYIVNMKRYFTYLKENLGLSHVMPRLIEPKGGGFLHFSAEDFDGERIFIKCGGLGDSTEREYKISKEMNERGRRNFIDVKRYKCHGNDKFLIQRFEEHPTLEKVIEDGSIGEIGRKKIFQELVEISKLLSEKRVLHRDLKPSNILVKENGDLLVIDFQFSIHIGNYGEMEEVAKNPKLVKGLGEEFALSAYAWDDNFSLMRILEEIGPDGESLEEYERCKEILSGNIGKITMRYRRGWKLKLEIKYS